MMELHSSYRQTTIFDQLWLALARGLRRPAWLQGRRVWGWSFGLLAFLFGVIGAAFLFDALTHGSGNDALASLGSALLAMGVFRHFASCALPLLQPHSERRPTPLARGVERPARPVPAPGRVPPGTGSLVDAESRSRPAAHLSAAERRVYLAGLRAAGVNVRIARALVSAGYVTGDRVRRAGDAEILAIRGVGPATLRKIRACFQG